MRYNGDFYRYFYDLSRSQWASGLGFRKAAVPIAACLLLLPACERAILPTPADTGLEADSLVADLFTLGSTQWLRAGGAVLTTLGESLLRENRFDTLGDAVILPAPADVRAFSAYVRRESDLACGPGPSREDALLIRFDDGLDGYCHDTLFAWVPAYPYRVPIAVSYAEGRGFWVAGSDLPLARGSLVIHFDRPIRRNHE